MSRLNDFVVDISLVSLPQRQMPFGSILIVTDEADHEFEEYINLEDILVDFTQETDTYKMAAQVFAQVPSPLKIAIVGDQTALPADITALLSANINNDFTVFYCTNATDAMITALDAWATQNHKIYAATTQNLALFSTILGRNTFLQFHSIAGVYFAECLMTHVIVRPIGSATAKFKMLSGVPESVITNAQLLTLHEAYGGTYIKDMGILQSTNSRVQSGEHLDVVLGAMWVKLEMEKGLRNLALTTDKIPYSNAGVALLVSIAERVLGEGAVNGVIRISENGKPEFTINKRPVQETTIAERSSRQYNYITWDAKLAGAIQGAHITGKLEV